MPCVHKIRGKKWRLIHLLKVIEISIRHLTHFLTNHKNFFHFFISPSSNKKKGDPKRNWIICDVHLGEGEGHTNEKGEKRGCEELLMEIRIVQGGIQILRKIYDFWPPCNGICTYNRTLPLPQAFRNFWMAPIVWTSPSKPTDAQLI